jgi:hypothetical protein
LLSLGNLTDGYYFGEKEFKIIGSQITNSHKPFTSLYSYCKCVFYNKIKLWKNGQLCCYNFIVATAGAGIIKLNTSVIYSFRNKLVFVLKNYTRVERLTRVKH